MNGDVAMRKPVLSAFILAGLAAVAIYLYTTEMRQGVNRDANYVVAQNETINSEEAEAEPPIERWKVLKELDNTTSIDVICYPSQYNIVDPEIVRVIANAVQASEYVESASYPNDEPDVKLYFRKKDGFVMAGRLYVNEGILSSPEGPLIMIEQSAVKKIMRNTDCS
ncbi:hypothetical protein SD71_17050 [Cohnella kolymensis]|uniref:DUF4830 domain-containing protein n=1 Tax=Cohnella kolymensis TaxID=1590652 RepID=A0ABR5A2A0_9BACL|nr:hypothetical protein [Cohnella kolymensis]KIL34758.1 hypothetical protein SD71_17050 [Cohnella kolymensis]